MGLIAIGDVHGCLKTLERLLDRLELTSEGEVGRWPHVFAADGGLDRPGRRDLLETGRQRAHLDHLGIEPVAAVVLGHPQAEAGAAASLEHARQDVAQIRIGERVVHAEHLPRALGTQALTVPLLGSGIALPQSMHGGPGRAGGGEELGGLRGLHLYLQRVALQGSRQMIERLYGSARTE